MKQVVAAVIVKDGKVLICQRTRHQPMPLKWEFPGGKIEPEEQPTEALCRELEEELGIEAELGPRLAIIRHTYSKDTGVELHFYLVERWKGEIQNRIFRDVRWIAPGELPGYDFLEADVVFIKDLAAGRISLPAGSQRHRSRSGQ
jgi:8-oxo-dGTP diphosphatase